MKPLNLNKESCDPVSSNCVIWQGPDLACIQLCKGDSVTEVVFKLATQLCEVLEILNIDTYDVSCLNLGDCGPKDFEALIQLLITKVCELNGVTPPTPGTTTGCPECVVNIAPCFYFTNPLGDQETTMQLTDYVTAIGNYICALAGQISTINNTLSSFDRRISDLENEPAPSFELPALNPICIATPGTPISALTFLSLLEEKFCALQAATGEPNALYTALLAQCAGLNQSPQLQGSGNMSSIVGWNATVSNLAQGFNNMWLTLCDMRAAIKTIQDTCCTGTTCDDLDITIEGVLTSPTTLQLYFTGTIPTGFGACQPSGTIITITDALGNSMTATVQVTPLLNDPAGFQVNFAATPINTSSNLIVSAPFCFTDGVSQCSKTVTEFVLNNTSCPTLILAPTQTTIDFNTNYTGGSASIAVKLFDGTGAVELSSQVFVVTGPTVVTGTFSALSAGTQYKVRLEITPTGAPGATLCPFTNILTIQSTCLPPTAVVAEPITT
jgi:hypothetical protein